MSADIRAEDNFDKESGAGEDSPKTGSQKVKATQMRPPPSFIARLLAEVDGIIARDPAARSRLEVILLYPSFHAVLLYWLSHPLYRRRWFVLARYISQLARWLTGIEIHPGAKIGSGLFIDHGMGVVIGETAEIGKNVTLYHDVTLGGVSPSENADDQRDLKRHPTLEDEVIVGSGAQILGPITVGKGARIGANAVVVKDVAPGDTMVGIPARAVNQAVNAPAASSEPDQASSPQFSPYGMPDEREDCDPLRDEIALLRQEIAVLKKAVAKTKTKNAPSKRTAPKNTTHKNT